MPHSELTLEVLAFLADHITTAQQLELLVRLVEERERWWDAAAAARELVISERDAHAALDHLARQNLLDIRITAEVRYQFRPGTDALRAAAVAATDAFRRRPVQVLEALAVRRRAARDFADAFRLRRHDDR